MPDLFFIFYMYYLLLRRFIVYVNKRSNMLGSSNLLTASVCRVSTLLKLLHAHEYYCSHGNSCHLFIIASPAGDGDTEGVDGKEGRSTCTVHTGQTSCVQ